MGYTFQPNTGYLMPANFGPVKRQDVLHYQEVTRLSISYITDKDALAALLPVVECSSALTNPGVNS